MAGAVRFELTARGFGAMVKIFHNFSKRAKRRKIGLFVKGIFHLPLITFLIRSNFRTLFVP